MREGLRKQQIREFTKQQQKRYVHTHRSHPTTRHWQRLEWWSTRKLAQPGTHAGARPSRTGTRRGSSKLLRRGGQKPWSVLRSRCLSSSRGCSSRSVRRSSVTEISSARRRRPCLRGDEQVKRDEGHGRSPRSGGAGHALVGTRRESKAGFVRPVSVARAWAYAARPPALAARRAAYAETRPHTRGYGLSCTCRRAACVGTRSSR